MSTHLTPEISARLDALVVAEDGTSIRVSEDRTVESETPKQLRGALATALYEEWHAGISPEASARRRRSPRRDHDLEALLAATVPHDTAEVEVTVGPRGAGPDGECVVVELHRVRVRVPLAGELGERLRHATPGDAVTLPFGSVRPSLSPGFLLVNGSTGGPGQGEILRLYLHVPTAALAPGVWGATLAALEDARVPYRAKVLSRRESYPRRDAVVVYLGERAWPVLPDVIAAATDLDALAADTSALAHRVAPGVAMAWDPRDGRPGWDRMSFGQHRGAVVAEAVVGVIEKGGPGDPAAVRAAVAASLVAASVDPAAPYRNTDSPALPSSVATPDSSPLLAAVAS
ncbi:T3SS effector HopA1 family protein [Jatrophihabitans sp. YIM 134969]